MKKYVFEEYRDKAGTGTVELFNTEDEAVNYAHNAWNNLFESDKQTYRIDACGTFRVYEIEISEEQLSKYEDGCLEVSIDDLWTRDVYDALD